MKLAEMAAEQKSRWLADHLEPVGCYVCWLTRDFVNDPAMTVTLIERMPYVQICRVNGIWRLWPFGQGPNVEHKHFGTAVVDASMLQMGWKEE